MPYVTESTRVNIILPITVRDMDGLGSFLESYTSLQVNIVVFVIVNSYVGINN